MLNDNAVTFTYIQWHNQYKANIQASRQLVVPFLLKSAAWLFDLPDHFKMICI